MNIELARLRREKLFSRLKVNEVVVLFAAEENSVEYCPYRQHSDFYYLTLFPEPNAVAVLVSNGNNWNYILFSRALDSEFSLWQGKMTGQLGARHEFMADKSFAVEEMPKILPELLLAKTKIYSNVGFRGKDESGFNQAIFNYLDTKRICLVDVGELLNEMRVVKDEQEVLSLRKACDVGVLGHLRAMERCMPGIYEFELEAELIYEFRRQGCRFSFEPIVAAGENSCVLHYTKNNQLLFEGNLVVVDVGADHEHYASDISRTYPINGKFTKAQRIIYELVLSAQEAVIAIIRPGINWNDLQLVADRVITEGLIEIGFLNGERDALINALEHKKFTIHKIGHWLGLDVHDIGGYQTNGNYMFLEEGMIFTVEPGIYLRSELLLKSKFATELQWHDLGVRIEDDILVTHDGCEVLTRHLPKKAETIEKIIGKYNCE